MFVRKKPNKNDVVSVQIIDKSYGRYKMLKTIGSSADAKEIEELVEEGKRWIKEQQGQIDMFSEQNKASEQDR